MQQIKEDLSGDYFVTGTYYPSGNKKIVKPYTNTNVSRWSSDLIGIKHIQLIAANITDAALCRIISVPSKTWRQGKQVSNGRHVPLERFNLQEKRVDIVKQGKDFFIYKVSEEK